MSAINRAAKLRWPLVLLLSVAVSGVFAVAGWSLAHRTALAQEAADENPQPKAKARVRAPANNPFPRRIDTPEFPRDMDWLNTGPLKKADLKGKFVLLDFWTYCCINCMHILPELKKLEDKYPNDLVVIGVHSAKFDGEKDTKNIRDAILRYNIAHPVVNDADHRIWNTYGVSSWPTIILIDPEGKAVWGRSGEFKADEVDEILKKGVAYYRGNGLMTDDPVKFALEVERERPTPLRFPGKVLADEASNRLFISDSNHNRIVIATLEGELLEIIGSGQQGKSDGDFATASFNQPQGMALNGDTLYVADTENHMLRKVDLAEKTVVTLSGDGEQGSNAFASGKPQRIKLNSPWDVLVHEKDLYIAMAGPHQIWRMKLDESSIGPYAGNGREDIVDGPLLPNRPYALGASSFAQPSGLASDGTWLYVADSEGSSIRAVPFNPRGEVKTVVGTNELPGGRLFYFGDVDGPRDRAKLQHCLCVAYLDGQVYVADAYNNKIKVVDAKNGATRTLVGTGEKGNDDAAPSFNEPAGLSIAGRRLYVADTNNHLIRVVDLDTRQVSTLTIAGLTPPTQKADAKPDFSDAARVRLPATRVKAEDGMIRLEVSIELPSGWKTNPLGKPNYWIDSPEQSGAIDRAAFGRRRLEEPSSTWTVEVPAAASGKDTLELATNYYYCQESDEGVCKVGAVVFTIPLTVSDNAPQSTVALRHTVRE
jgi:thiol-disulfide isomerase/thioredoxin/sugar lactone lactonase YvrE